MKAKLLLKSVTILTVLGKVFLNNAPSAIAVPAPIFQPILQEIRTQLPRGMVMRLPAFVPDAGITTYAIVSGYFPDNGFFRVDFAATPDCGSTSCNMGNIFVSHENLKLPDRQLHEQPITLKPGIRGFYYYARSGSAGYRHHVYWKQDGLFFEVQSRAMSKQQVIDMAISMAMEPPIDSAK